MRLFGGGGGLPPGLTVVGTVPLALALHGQQTIWDTPAGEADGDNLLDLRQTSNLTDYSYVSLLTLERYGSVGAFDFAEPMISLDDQTAGTAPLVTCTKNAATVFRVPATVQAVTGALSTVTDPAAKAVLASIINMLVSGYSMGTNSTT